MELENCFFDTDDFVQTNKKLGEGAFGKVYVVENPNEDVLYATKKKKKKRIHMEFSQVTIK